MQCVPHGRTDVLLRDLPGEQDVRYVEQGERRVRPEQQRVRKRERGCNDGDLDVDRDDDDHDPDLDLDLDPDPNPAPQNVSLASTDSGA